MRRDPSATSAEQAHRLVTLTDGPAQAYGVDGTPLASTASVKGIQLASAPDIRRVSKHPGSVGQRDARRAVFGGRPFADAPVILVAADLRDRNEALEDLLHQLEIGALVVLVLSTGIAYAMSRGALAPVEHLRAEAEALSHSDETHLLQVPATEDEIGRLAITLNRLLSRLHATVERERRFVIDAGHELRTPLSIAHAELELLLESERPDAERAALTTALDELHDLTLLSQRLLDLGGIARGSLEIERIPARELLENAVRRQRLLRGEDAQLRVEVEPGVQIVADRHLVGMALTNLLDNAFRYGAPPVTLTAHADEHAVTIRVRDCGPGFPSEFIEHAFDPFTRVDSARTSRGTGIGLAIVLDIMRAHQGHASIDSDSSIALVFPVGDD